MRRLAAAAALALSACATTELAPRTSTAIRQEDEEAGLWASSRETEERLLRNGRALKDPALEAYLLGVVRRLQPPAAFAAIPFRVHLLRDPVPNAFCLPDGAIFVHTGMLAAMESEAELAALLGHETTHATHRHALRQLRAASNGGVVNILLAGGARLLTLASVQGYGRDLEREADRVGLGLAADAGYDAGAAARLHERLLDQAKAAKVPDTASAYASHPQLTERIESATRFAAGRRAGASGAEPFAAATAALLPENARLEAGAGRFASARAQAARYVALRPGSGLGPLAEGEIARREAAAGWEETALASYRRAVELEPATAEAWRGIGLVLQRKGDADGARRAFARYLELAPDAADRAHFRAMIDTTGGTP